MTQKVYLHGRLGNVLFQLAHYISIYDSIECIITSQQTPFIKDIQKAFNLKFKTIPKSHFTPDETFGYFQSEKLFDIRLIREKFAFCDEYKCNISNKYPSLANLNFNNMVSMTVRRGDYITLDSIWKWFDSDYYKNTYKNLFNNLPVLISSDDIEWCRKNIKLNTEIIFLNEITNNAVELLYFLSKCKHSIGSASSFSWWVAWLNEQKDSINIFPNKWYNHNKMNTHNKPKEDIDMILPLRWKQSKCK